MRSAGGLCVAVRVGRCRGSKIGSDQATVRPEPRPPLAVGPGVVIGVVVVTPTAAPAPTAAGAAGVLAALVAAAGRGAWERPAAAIVLGAHRLRPFERDELATVLTELCRVGLRHRWWSSA